MYYPELNRYTHFAYDTETTGLEWHKDDRVFGLSISLPDGRDYYYDTREDYECMEWLNQSLKDYKGDVICHNAPFDFHMSEASGIDIPMERLDDTVVRACLIDEHLFSYELDALSKKYLGRGKDTDIYKELGDIFGGRRSKNVQVKNFPKAPREIMSRYAIVDSRNTLDLWEWQQVEILKQGIQPITRWERSLTPTLLRAESAGVRVDIDAAEIAHGTISDEMDRLEFELFEAAGGKCINFQPSDDIQMLFSPKYRDGQWYSNDGTPLNTTDGGKASINQDALQKMRHPAAKLILELRKLAKLRDVFIHGHILSNQSDGYVHPRIHQSKGPDGGTGTGRFSYSSPALQQIPSRDRSVSSVIRPIFLPDPGHKWVDCDLASFEVRVFAHLVNDPSVIKEYRRNPHLDLHGYVAKETNLPRNKPPEGGSNAKQLNLSMIFVAGNGLIAEQMGLPWEWSTFVGNDGKDVTYRKAGYEAMEIIDRYHERFPGVKKLANKAKAVAEERGYVYTLKGRRLRFPNGWRTYKASGLLIQATAADWNKENWTMVEDVLQGEGRMVLNTHDSYGLSLPEGREEELARRVKRVVEETERCRVPLILEVNPPGINWWDSYDKKVWFK